MVKILVACEASQQVTKAFRKLGHTAFSCDTQPAYGGHADWHIKGDCVTILNQGWDMMIAHPPCTYLTNAGNRWFNTERYGEKAHARWRLRVDAESFVKKLWQAPIPYIVIENPVGWLNSHWRKPDQTIQPYQFGDYESKRTCLWLKGLPTLEYTTPLGKPKIYGYYKSGNHKGEPIYFHSHLLESFPSARSRKRSETFPGVAAAMSSQWSFFVQKKGQINVLQKNIG